MMAREPLTRADLFGVVTIALVIAFAWWVVVVVRAMVAGVPMFD